MSSRTSTVRRLSVAAIVLVGLSAPATSSGAATQRARRITYTATFQPTGGAAPCDPTMPTRCVGTFQNVITYTGDITGTSYASGSAALAPDGIYRATAIEQFSGTIAGCGTGTMIIEQVGTLDPATGVADGSWRIVAGAGNGDLADATGGSVRSRSGTETQAIVRCR